MALRVDHIFDTVFLRKRVKSGSDLAHSVVPVVSLTILSAIIGVNASDLENSIATTALVATAILSLSIFFVVMEALWEAVRARQILRAVVIFVVAVVMSRIVSPMLADLSGNTSLVDGVLFGWLLSFPFVAYLARADEDRVGETEPVDRSTTTDD